MSMMGRFQELPPGLLERLRTDPSLVRDVVRGSAAGRPLPAGVEEQMNAAVEQMKRSVAESGERFLQVLPPEQREVIRAMPPEQQKQVFASLADRLMSGWKPEIAGATGAPARVGREELGLALDIDKAWHGVHFLLTGTAEEAPGPLGQVVLGGTEIGEDIGHGPARYLLPDAVDTVATALEAASSDELRRRYDAAALEAAEIYPGGWNEPDKVDWVLEAFEDVRRFYRAAARRKSGVLVFLA
jgi:hypothetical protein